MLTEIQQLIAVFIFVIGIIALTVFVGAYND
jgi:hypothetical protein